MTDQPDTTPGAPPITPDVVVEAVTLGARLDLLRELARAVPPQPWDHAAYRRMQALWSAVDAELLLELFEQRDRARSIAVRLEQEVAQLGLTWGLQWPGGGVDRYASQEAAAERLAASPIGSHAVVVEQRWVAAAESDELLEAAAAAAFAAFGHDVATPMPWDQAPEDFRITFRKVAQAARAVGQ